MTAAPLYRPLQGRVFAGVCVALARRFGLDVTGVRLGMALLGLFTGIGIILYIALWVAVPSEW